MGLSVVILAAGKGKRMTSNIPKVLHSLGGVPLLERVVKTAQTLNADTIHVVYGNGGKQVREKLGYLPVNWVEQEKQLGTGHALLQAIPFCHDDDQILVLYGDVPLISSETLTGLLQNTPPNGLGLVVSELPDPRRFGRIIRDECGNIISIVEYRDSNDQQRKICEINTGILTASAKNLKNWLARLTNNNCQQEYYLTDTVALAVAAGCPVKSVKPSFCEEAQGVNDRWELIYLERYYQHLIVKKLALSGVTIADPDRIDIRGEKIQVSHDVFIDVNVVLEGEIQLGANVRIGPNVILKNVIIGNDTEIYANSIIEGARIAAHCSVGPFARIRSDSVLEKGAKVGNFVEIKKTILGPNSKANHLTYLGDASIGKNVNIGAGTITCNYDGVNKWETKIEDGAFIGSNTSLVAPLIVGKEATIGAGSTITQNVPPHQLTLARKRQSTIKDWRRAKESPENTSEDHSPE
ncbi:bifunctional UDP-N-acetylglucosamine diphosphorylase/glucosamine-1-phosphate N-acetyltransferase GlmU [Coxiella-like endosymbiont]|uniref:bifunctional UDP-N-acetylglucosamine diphosphorylase/glucosamine-1-phosphate N-acetyltransferase GlmU n=1 Tax=Coxiella-like endosymbiont TaxID=1592897 RepID=UPI00272C17B7|nr:bifunctional UDP-N-acetylglucosamine diphosphorylase/glucosamine-1-phosphate N-acetyltransferase GlmU [Coxiella-like endosymbiont]